MSNRRKVRGPYGPRKPKPKPDIVGHWPEMRKYNGYQCEVCDRVFISVDLHEGVTPMFSPCFATEGCRGKAHSLGYPEGGKKPPEKFGPAIIEWYKPTEAEYQKMSYELQQHIRKGGLARRASRDAPNWVKEIA